MGGGASQQGTSIEQLLTTTYMIGRTIAAMTCPGMFRIYDFHSALAPRLKTSKKFVFFAEESDDDDDDESELPPDPSQYENMFNVQVGEDVIYIEKPIEPNPAGWTPLHSCCMSFLTVPAGHKLIDEMIRRGASLDMKTNAGPGTFNKGWTALHMACAYGVEPLVERLVKEGADVNTTNCFGYTPMLEACHRGFVNIVTFLLRGGVNLRYIPSDEESLCSPFANAPAQTPLGEAARCGFPKIVQHILDAGAVKDQVNSIGWTALHEACFYNRAEVAKTLLLAGASASIRTRIGALPYHFAGLESIRTMLKEMGGPDAVPEAGDVIDMVQVLHELTMSETSIVAGPDGTLQVVSTGSRQPRELDDLDEAKAGPGGSSQALTTPLKGGAVGSSSSSSSSPGKTPSGSRGAQSSEKGQGSGSRPEEDDDKGSACQLLHSGPMLGDLPSFSAGKVSPGKLSGASMNFAIDQPERLSPSSRLGPGLAPGGPCKRADDKKKKKKKKAGGHESPPPDMPREFLCQLTDRPMSEPVRTTYGHVFEKAAIVNWLHSQGKCCPLTGAPLAEVDLKPQDELGDRIRQWILQKGLSKASDGGGGGPAAGGPAESASTAGVVDSKAAPEDDLYDF